VPAAPDRLTIGQVARLSGLTTRALRHYDKLGVLRPAEVADGNGYRLYDRDQVEIARHIRILRELEVPLDEIRRILADPGSEDAARRIAAHRRRIHARLTELRTTHYFLGQPLPQVAAALGIPLGTAKSRLHRSLAAMRIELEAGPAPGPIKLQRGQSA